MSLTDYLASKGASAYIESHKVIGDALLKNSVSADDSGRWVYHLANLVAPENVHRYFHG